MCFVIVTVLQYLRMKDAKEARFVHGRSDFCDDVSACCDSIFDLDQLTFKVHHVVTSSTFGGKESMFNFFYIVLVLGLLFELHVRELTNEGKAASYKTIRARLTLSSDVTWDTCSEKRLVFIVVCFLHEVITYLDEVQDQPVEIFKLVFFLI